MNVNLYVHGMISFGAVVSGMIPESGPHLVVVMRYSQNLVPVSILFTTSFVQDGHGMLPLLSYSIKDSVFIKVFNRNCSGCLGRRLKAISFRTLRYPRIDRSRAPKTFSASTIFDSQLETSSANSNALSFL